MVLRIKCSAKNPARTQSREPLWCIIFNDLTMRHFILLLSFLTILSCQTKTNQQQLDMTTESNESNLIDNNSIESETDLFCDTNKVKDFITNLTLIEREIPKKVIDYQESKANEFIDYSCKQDTSYCGKIEKKIHKTYEFDNEWTVYLTGYAFVQSTGMEENSVSFFVLSVYRNNEPWFTDMLSDLMGEIKVELNGFEFKKSQVTIWGKAFPYFEPDYGKFRLTINDGKGFYEFQCHSQN